MEDTAMEDIVTEGMVMAGMTPEETAAAIPEAEMAAVEAETERI